MIVSVSGFFSNCYNYINNQLSNLSPLQKKVAVFAITYFSCATVGYFIYRLYCFRAHSRQESERDEEMISTPPVERKNMKVHSYKQKKVEMSQPFTEHQEELYKKSTKIEINKDDSEIFREEKAPWEEGAFDLEKALNNLEQEALKKKEIESIKQEEETQQKVDDLGEKILLRKDELTVEDDPFINLDLEALSQEVSPKKQKSSSFPPLTLSPILTFKPNRQDNRQIEIEKRLKKNCDYAVAQQKVESPQNFFAVRNSPDDYNGIPITIIKTEDSHHRPVGIAASQGRRSTMEDASDATTISFVVNGETHTADMFGVFDGHAGDGAAHFVQKNLAGYLKEALEKHNQTELTNVGIWDALKSCFKKLDEDFYNEIAGTTATVAFILNGKVWIANVGDSRAILVKKDGVATQASEDAKPNVERYRKKIEKLGGYVQFWGCWRVNANLAVARAIGDKGIKGTEGKCCVLPNPKITCYSLKDYLDGYLVLACDGLYDAATTDEVGLAVKTLADVKTPTEEMAKDLVYAAINNGSKDNVSVVVIGLTQ